MTSINNQFDSELEFERYLQRFDPPPSYEEAVSQTLPNKRVGPHVIDRRTHPSSDLIDMIYSSQSIQSRSVNSRSVNRNRRRKRTNCICC